MPTTKTNKNRGLGKGFDVLMPRDFDTSLLVDASDRVQKLKVDHIQSNSNQPRRYFDETALQQLAKSITQYGILQPIIVTLVDEDKYMIIAGERRWRAAKIAKLKTVPAIVRSHQELERLEIALVENVQRVDLSPLEQAASIERLHQQFSKTYEIIAERLGKATSTVTNLVRLLQLPEEAQQALREKKIVEGHARQIVSLKDSPEKQHELLKLVIKNDWSVRQAERFVTAYKNAAPDTKATALQAHIRNETPETKRLGKRIKAPVSIRRTAHGGKLEIGFTSEQDLERLLRFLLISQ
ncbi:MAG TPA: ParB/RepB/Spo0J family partition protein [Candidatus Saccharimonadales bacterium]|nr:ParB/RepB/Spo0J family partition protein [Candidatus Saccharimonadales bacterium]